MIRILVTIAGMTLWLLCFGAAMFTIIPLAGMGLAALFDGSFTVLERLQGFGFLVLGLILVAALLFTLTRMSRFTEAYRAQD